MAGLLLALSACGSGTESGTGSGSGASLSLDALHDKAVAAGVDCTNYQEWDGDLSLIGEDVTEAATCNPGGAAVSAMTVYGSHAAAAAAVNDEAPTGEDDGMLDGSPVPRGPRVLGQNWVLNLPDVDSAADIAATLDGELVDADPGYVEQQECVAQTMDFVVAVMPDAYGNNDEAAFRNLVFTYGTDSVGYKVAIGSAIPRAFQDLRTMGAGEALLAARAEASVGCADALAP